MNCSRRKKRLENDTRNPRICISTKQGQLTVIVVRKVKELLTPHPGVAAIDVAYVGDRDDHKIAARDLGVWRETAEDCQRGKQQKHIPELQHEHGRPRCDGEMRHAGLDLRVVEFLRVGEGGVPAHCARWL
jgi:hypothetical protein